MASQRSGVTRRGLLCTQLSHAPAISDWISFSGLSLVATRTPSLSTSCLMSKVHLSRTCVDRATCWVTTGAAALLGTTEQPLGVMGATSGRARL